MTSPFLDYLGLPALSLMTPEMADMLKARERLLIKIEFLIDEYFQAQIDECGEMGEMSNFLEAKLALTHDICDAVCQHYPITKEEA